MNALALNLRRLRWGWAVGLTDGRELARFAGPGAKGRAERYATGLSGEQPSTGGRLTSQLRRLVR